MFKKAQRNQSKLRLALVGPSGSGKTYSSLLIAEGLGRSIALIDSERGSGNLYSDINDYDIAQLEPPFTPEKYIQTIKEAEQAGYTTIIVDSLSHAWAGPGGILEYVDKSTQSLKNNFAAWREASPKHNALVDALIQSKSHIIATMRSKTVYEVQYDEKKGKTKPVKIGLAPIQREGLDYEFTCVFELSLDGHVASASKDRTGIFDGQYFTPSTETGKHLKAWLNDKKDLRLVKPGADHVKSKQFTEIFERLRDLGLAEFSKEYEGYLLKKYGLGLKDLDGMQLKEQVENLTKCREDPEMLGKLQDYLVKLAA